jgi:hypothetical protein
MTSHVIQELLASVRESSIEAYDQGFDDCVAAVTTLVVSGATPTEIVSALERIVHGRPSTQQTIERLNTRKSERAKLNA